MSYATDKDDIITAVEERVRQFQSINQKVVLTIINPKYFPIFDSHGMKSLLIEKTVVWGDPPHHVNFAYQIYNDIPIVFSPFVSTFHVLTELALQSNV